MDTKLILPCDVGEVSDGYHTFDELYNHRCTLWCIILTDNKELAFKTKLNDKKEVMEGWFIAGLDTPYGQITYHLPMSMYDRLNVKEIEYNANYDGHDSEDALLRLRKFLELKK